MPGNHDNDRSVQHGLRTVPQQLHDVASRLPVSHFFSIALQDKRVVVTIQYSAESGLKPYFLTVAKKIKASNPDVILEKRILPAVNEGGEPTFEVVVDEKVVVGKNNARMQRSGSDKIIQDSTGGMSVFVSMGELDLAISKARRRRRPHTMYGKEDERSIREMLRRDGNDVDEEN